MPTARRRIQPPPEGGTAGRDEEIARLLRENLELRIRAEIEAEERHRAERTQERRYQGTGGEMNSSKQRGQPGTFIVGFGKPAPKLEKKAASYFAWSKQFITWAVTNTCDDALTETSDPITLQGPRAKCRGEL